MIARSDSVSRAELFRLHHLLLFLHHKVTRGILTSSSVSELTLPALTVCMFSQFNTQKTKIIQWNIFPSKKFFLLFMALTASFLLFCQQYICPICTKSNAELMNCYYYICYYTVRPRPRANISLTPRSRPLYFTALGSSLTCISIIITCIIYRCGDSYCLSLKVKKL